jgi:hypothetical protein
MSVSLPAPSRDPIRGARPLLVVSALLAGLQVADAIAWSRAFDRGHSQGERVAIYLAGLPVVLAHAGTLRLTLLAALCGAVGVACALPAANRGGRLLTVLGRVFFGGNCLLVAWHLFTLM